MLHYRHACGLVAALLLCTGHDALAADGASGTQLMKAVEGALEHCLAHRATDANALVAAAEAAGWPKFRTSKGKKDRSTDMLKISTQRFAEDGTLVVELAFRQGDEWQGRGRAIGCRVSAPQRATPLILERLRAAYPGYDGTIGEDGESAVWVGSIAADGTVSKAKPEDISETVAPGQRFVTVTFEGDAQWVDLEVAQLFHRGPAPGAAPKP